MLDFVLGLALATLLVRGWMRGFVREVLDLVGLILGVVAAFRLSRPLGDFLADRFGVVPEGASIGAGIVIFLVVGVALTVAARVLSTVMKLPGLNLINRVGGALVAVGWGIGLALLLITVLQALPLQGTLDSALAESKVAKVIAGEDSVPRSVFERVLAAGPVLAVGQIRDVFGTERVVPENNDVHTFTPVSSDEVRQVRDDATDLLARVNEYRTGEGLNPLALSSSISVVAEIRAVAMYTTGRLSRETPIGGDVSVDLAAAGLSLVRSGEIIALASSQRAAFAGMTESVSGKALLDTSGFDRAGVAVVEGPIGRVVVLILGQ